MLNIRRIRHNVLSVVELLVKLIGGVDWRCFSLSLDMKKFSISYRLGVAPAYYDTETGDNGMNWIHLAMVPPSRELVET